MDKSVLICMMDILTNRLIYFNIDLRDAPIWGKRSNSFSPSIFQLFLNHFSTNPLLFYPSQLPSCPLFFLLSAIICIFSHGLSLSCLLGLLYLDVYRHGRDPLTHHASTSNINLDEQGVTNEAANSKNKPHRGPLAV